MKATGEQSDPQAPEITMLKKQRVRCTPLNKGVQFKNIFRVNFWFEFIPKQGLKL